MKNLLWIVGLLVLLHACNLGDKKADAYGNFEANDIMVSAEATGQLLDWQIDEGMLLKKRTASWLDRYAINFTAS
jgi:HlyD family secretion protein